MKIPIEHLQMHNISLNHLEDDELGTYQTYLDKTDYIVCKIFEGVATWEDYQDEKTYRQIAREEIAKLQ